MTVKDLIDACFASAIDFTFYNVHGDICDFATFDRNDDQEKQDCIVQKLKNYEYYSVAAFTTFNDIIRVHVVTDR